jgi:hypothetical protein
MLSLLYPKIGGILRLLAILVATLAPTVSQTLSADQSFDVMLGAFCSQRNGRDVETPRKLTRPDNPAVSDR